MIGLGSWGGSISSCGLSKAGGDVDLKYLFSSKLLFSIRLSDFSFWRINVHNALDLMVGCSSKFLAMAFFILLSRLLHARPVSFLRKSVVLVCCNSLILKISSLSLKLNPSNIPMYLIFCALAFVS